MPPPDPLLTQISDLATALLALIGIPGIILTFFQLDHARKSRLATIYLTISEEWDDLIAARNLITISAFEGQIFNTHTERGALLLDILEGREPFKPAGEHDLIVNEILRQDLDRCLETVLSFLEDLGLLCRRGYVSQNDVSEIIGPSITEIVAIMLPYISRERASYEIGPAVYANTLWLYERLATAPQFTIPGHGTPKLFCRPL